MRIGVIRGDIPGPIFVADLEPTSQVNVPTEPAGQTRYISRPTAATVGPFVATVPATLVSSGTVTFPLTINAGNQTLKVKSAVADAYTTVLVATGVYANMTALVTAVNAALLNTAFKAQAFSTTKLALMTVATGESVRIQHDSTAGGSTFNTPGALAAAGANFTVPSAGALIAATLPVGGPLDVRAATIRTTLGAGLTNAQVTAAADLIAPKFVESNTVLDSFLSGDIKQLLSASFNPDPSRIPALTSGPAITVVQDDGNTLFTYAAPTLTNGQVNVPVAGAVTLTGLNLASPGSPNAELQETKVAFYVNGQTKTVTQYAIVAAGGTVTTTSIVVPASVVPAGALVAGIKAQVQYKTFVSNKFTLV